MTPNTTATNGQTPSSDKSKATRGRKPAKRKATAKRGARDRSAAGGYSDTASRLMSRGKQEIGGAYVWAANGAGRALPQAARHLPDRKTLQGVLEERPFLLGAIGLGVGAMIGMMLPGHLVSGYSSLRRGGQTAHAASVDGIALVAG